MTRRGIPNHVNWYIREWMDRLGKSQADMMREAGWSRATASQVYTGKQDYKPSLVNSAAVVFLCAPYELLMPYDEAMALRRVRQDALTLAESGRKLGVTSRTGTDG